LEDGETLADRVAIGFGEQRHLRGLSHQRTHGPQADLTSLRQRFGGPP